MWDLRSIDLWSLQIKTDDQALNLIRWTGVGVLSFFSDIISSSDLITPRASLTASAWKTQMHIFRHDLSTQQSGGSEAYRWEEISRDPGREIGTLAAESKYLGSKFRTSSKRTSERKGIMWIPSAGTWPKEPGKSAFLKLGPKSEGD